MHGLGDNLHQRSVVKHLLQNYQVWLETPWPCLYHDIEGLRIISKGSRLRTQAKNAAREADRFERAPVPTGTKKLRVSYPPAMVRAHRSVLGAMSAQCEVPVGDFRLPVRDEWLKRADELIASFGTDKPLMIYRPLVERSEWGGCHTRNPDTKAYADLYRLIRDQFFVVSVADLEPRKEWMVGETVDADVEYHAGELDIEILAGLFKRAELIFTAPGFAVVLAQAVGTPVVSVFGGYEGSYSFSEGAKYTPTLNIAPIQECDCFSHTHKCKKAIDMPSAVARLTQFVGEHIEITD